MPLTSASRNGADANAGRHLKAWARAAGLRDVFTAEAADEASINNSAAFMRGTYRINVSVDQGPWIAPPGIPDMHDDFGGMVGLLEL